MPKAKVALTIDADLLDRVDALVAKQRFRNRSQAVEAALAEKLARLARARLAEEAAKIIPKEERRLAEEGLAATGEAWPKVSRGEIRWADLNPVRGREQAGERPVLILSHDVFNDRSGTVIAVALTSQEPKAGYPLTLELTTANSPKRSWVKPSQIRTLSTERIGKRLGRVSDEELASVLEGLFEIIG